MLKLTLLCLGLAGCTEITFQESEDDDMHPLNAPKQSHSGGWSKSQDMVFFDTLRELSMQANFPVAGFYTVQFGVEQDPSFLTNPDIIADVTWSVEGNDIRRKISVGNGTTISGTGQACSVKVRDASIFGPVGQVYTVKALLSPGVRPGSLSRPFLRGIDWDLTSIIAPSALINQYLVSIGAGQSVRINVPVNAGVISADVEATLSSGLTLDPTFVGVGQLNLSGLFKSYYPLVETGFVPVYPSSTFLIISNAAATPIVVSVLWGIDG
jgi:hypothetical protein